MKPKYVISLLLVLVGTNLFTYETSRYFTTCVLLKRARARVEDVVESQQAGGVEPRGQPFRVQIDRAIGNAGGMYYGWNEGLLYWGIGGLLAISGLLVTRLEPSQKDVAPE
jgi:hypothetical protein